jgi:hypothetical protein
MTKLKKEIVDAPKAFVEVAAHAEKIKNDAAHKVEIIDIGEAWAQGDIAIIRLAGLPQGANPIDRPSAQLALGTTQGSRHVIADMATVKLYTLPDATPLDGPIIESSCGFTVEHPEHGDVSLPAGTYAVVYQRAFAEELRRIED